jgi:hypothetical protein
LTDQYANASPGPSGIHRTFGAVYTGNRGEPWMTVHLSHDTVIDLDRLRRVRFKAAFKPGLVPDFWPEKPTRKSGNWLKGDVAALPEAMAWQLVTWGWASHA